MSLAPENNWLGFKVMAGNGEQLSNRLWIFEASGQFVSQVISGFNFKSPFHSKWLKDKTFSFISFGTAGDYL